MIGFSSDSSCGISVSWMPSGGLSFCSLVLETVVIHAVQCSCHIRCVFFSHCGMCLTSEFLELYFVS